MFNSQLVPVMQGNLAEDKHNINNHIKQQAGVIANLEERIEVVTNAYQRQEKDMKFREQEIQSYKDGYYNMEKQFKQYVEREQELQNMIEEMRSEIKKLQMVCENKTNELSHINSQLQDNTMERNIQRQKIQNADQIQEYTLDLKGQIKRLEMENEHLKGYVKSHQPAKYQSPPTVHLQQVQNVQNYVIQPLPQHQQYVQVPIYAQQEVINYKQQGYKQSPQYM